MDYRPTIEAMKAFTKARGSETPDELWVLEHPPVFTQGIAGKEEHLLSPGDIEVVQTDRGGQVTYHGPGQIVIYVLCDIRRAKVGVRQLVSAPLLIFWRPTVLRPWRIPRLRVCTCRVRKLLHWVLRSAGGRVTMGCR